MIRALSILYGLILASVLVFALCGCATKGGWPCFSWQKNTDQKNEAAGAEYIKQQSIAATNQPMPMNYNDVLKPSVGGFIPKVAPLPPGFQHWKDTNGCSWSVLNGKTNGPICPLPRPTTFTCGWNYDAPTDNIVFLVQSSRTLLAAMSQWPLKGIVTSNSFSCPLTNPCEWFSVRASNTLTGQVSDYATK